MKKFGEATIREKPWHSGKIIKKIKLDENGCPQEKDISFAEDGGYMITAFEPVCGGIRWYTKDGWV